MGFGTEEIISNSVQCVDLLRASPEELRVFKEKVGQNDGEIDVLVHPFYQRRVGGFQHRVVTESYSMQRDQLLREGLSNNKPFVVLEEEGRINQLFQDFNSHGKGEVYVVSTESDTHILNDGQKGWDQFIRILKNSGVKNVVVGGMWMQIYKSEFAIANLDESAGGNPKTIKEFIKKIPEYLKKFPKAASWLKEDLIPLGCAGMAAIDFLRSGIDVSISSAATPCSTHEDGFIGYFQQHWAPPDLSEEI